MRMMMMTKKMMTMTNKMMMMTKKMMMMMMTKKMMVMMMTKKMMVIIRFVGTATAPEACSSLCFRSQLLPDLSRLLQRCR